MGATCRLVIAVAVLLVSAAPVPARQQIVVGERLTIASKVLGEERTILVSVPEGYGEGEQRYPVLYLADGDTHIVHTRATVDFLARQGMIPQLLVVGIADTDGATDLSRGDVGGPAAGGKTVGSPTSGAVDAFLNFVARELIPYVDAHYRTAPFRIFSGHSFGGVLGTYALLTRPGLFNAVIAASPDLAWDNGVIVKSAREFVSAGIDLTAAYFVTLGNRKAPERRAFEALASVLRNNHSAGFRWGSMVLDDSGPDSIVRLSNYYGLRKIFEGWAMPTHAGTGGGPVTVADVRAHYAALSARLGFTVNPDERTVNRLGYQALQSNERDTALQLFRFNVAAHPDSANAHFSLGEALEADGQFDLALGNYRRAYEIATKNGDPDALIFKRHVEHLAGTPTH
jgi:predicted alpha/beta superfamily hydrolase